MASYYGMSLKAAEGRKIQTKRNDAESKNEKYRMTVFCPSTDSTHLSVTSHSQQSGDAHPTILTS